MSSQSSSETGPEIGLPNLPDEVWRVVFSYFWVEDRKSIRLTCCRFYDYDLANDVGLQETEEMDFYGNMNVEAAIESFSSSSRRSWNIKLNELYRRKGLPAFLFSS